MLGSTTYIPSSSLVLAHLFFLFFHMNKNVVEFPSLCLGMSSVYASVINAFLVALECVIILRMCVLYCDFKKLL